MAASEDAVDLVDLLKYSDGKFNAYLQSYTAASVALLNPRLSPRAPFDVAAAAVAQRSRTCACE